MLRWLGLTLVVLLALQLVVFLGAADWNDSAFQQVLIDRLVDQAPMGLVGLLLMLIGSRLDQPTAMRTPIRWVVCGLSSLLAVAMIAVVPMVVASNQTIETKANETIAEVNKQLEEARQQTTDEAFALQWGEQLAQAGRLAAGASDEEKIKAAQELFKQQLPEMETAAEKQISEVEIQRDRALLKGTFGGTVSAVVMAVAFVLLALAAVL